MPPIKIAGLLSDWSEDYAKAYADKVFEMGMYSKSFLYGQKWVVAYSHKSFTKTEAEHSLSLIVQEK